MPIQACSSRTALHFRCQCCRRAGHPMVKQSQLWGDPWYYNFSKLQHASTGGFLVLGWRAAQQVLSHHACREPEAVQVDFTTRCYPEEHSRRFGGGVLRRCRQCAAVRFGAARWGCLQRPADAAATGKAFRPVLQLSGFLLMLPAASMSWCGSEVLLERCAGSR